MKYVAIFFIRVYQLLVSPLFHAVTGSTSGCRYQPTCSEYAKEVITEHGIKTGVPMALKRLSTCHPFAKAL